jgi:YVTN family beta-propeller protein
MVSEFCLSVSIISIFIIVLSSSLSSSFDYSFFLKAAQAHSITIPIRGTIPYGIAYNSANNNMYVANLDSSTVSVISGSTDSVIATILVGRVPIGIAYAPPNNKLYVTNLSSNDVYVINGATNKVIKNIPVGINPLGIAYNPSNNNVYVTNIGDGTITVINTSTDTVVSTIELVNIVSPPPAITNPVFFAYSPANVAMYVGASGQVSVIHSVSNADVKDSRMPPPDQDSQAAGLAYNNNNNRVYVSAYDSNSVVRINPDTNDFEGTAIPVGMQPIGIVYNPINKNMYVANSGSNTVSVIGPTNSVIATIPTGLNPIEIAYNSDNRHIYVTNSGSNTVSVIHS